MTIESNEEARIAGHMLNELEQDMQSLRLMLPRYLNTQVFQVTAGDVFDGIKDLLGQMIDLEIGLNKALDDYAAFGNPERHARETAADRAAYHRSVV